MYALYSSSCDSNASIEGILTTLIDLPSSLSAFAASIAKETSDPVAMIIPSGFSTS